MAEVFRTCGGCQYFVHARHASGRVDKKHYGECSCIVTFPKAPMHYAPPPVPYSRGHIWHDQNAESCDCYKEKANG